MNIIILGPPGSGKGTQAEIIAKKHNLEHVDMGKALRAVAKLDTPLGKKIHEIINVKKELVGDKILKEVLHVKLGDLPREQGVVFDGVPRRRDQLDYFESALQEFGRKVDTVVSISLPEEEAVKRIGIRWTCKKCGRPLIMGKDIKSPNDKCVDCGGEIYQRMDQTEEATEKRYGIFREETMPVIEYYRQKGILIEIDGRPSIEEVSKEILKKIEKLDF